MERVDDDRSEPSELIASEWPGDTGFLERSLFLPAHIILLALTGSDVSMLRKYGFWKPPSTYSSHDGMEQKHPLGARKHREDCTCLPGGPRELFVQAPEEEVGS